jgi:hypothetical protein
MPVECIGHLVTRLHLLPPNQNLLYEGVQVQMKNEIRWLALLAVLAYAVVQVVSPTFFNHAVSLTASAVWGN